MLLQTLQAAYAADLADPSRERKLKRGYRSLFADSPEKIDEIVNNNLIFLELAASGAGYSRWYLWKHNGTYFIVSCAFSETLTSFNFTEVALNENGRFDEIET